MYVSASNKRYLLGLLYLRRKYRQAKKVRQHWVHPLLTVRYLEGSFYTLFEKLRKDNSKFFNYFRMSIDTFDFIVERLLNSIKHQNTPMRACIPPKELVAVTIRFFAPALCKQMSGGYNIPGGGDPPPLTQDSPQQIPSNVYCEDVIFVDSDHDNIHTPIQPIKNDTACTSKSTEKPDYVLSADTAISRKSRPKNTDNRFRNSDTGPYFVFVEHLDLNLGRLHPMKLGEKLAALAEYEKHILEISTVGRNRIKIELDSGDTANKLIEDSLFEANNLVAYIPNHLTEKRGKLLPQFVFINKVRCPVETYISPVMQCFQCLRYGHSASQCKSSRRCRKCGSADTDNNHACNVYCVYCKNNSHDSTFRDCPEYKKQLRTKEAMANLNISFKEAEKVIDNPCYTSIIQKNRFAPLINSDIEFPPLTSSSQSTSSPTQQPSHKAASSPQPSPFANPPKKRKTRDTSPNFAPIRREYNSSFCAGPVFQSEAQESCTESDQLINQLTAAIKKLLQQCLQDYISEKTPLNDTAQANCESELDTKIKNILAKVFA
ncbi:unnamed protein product [Acanthoscelides obtectus]|uniref:CCHC-type domain-containing protein n=1 Tax=Acanthoscelides obtectus TaxID=200917 RepID=A0A9P0L4P0_ACAOB|nr:unnamed protein product [Acanthoscelides obtectus]CAK1627789.1 hypothetical protein AOBTE_LOCUS4823 [Acanthoscelides obtectus]